jgi:uncharacterized protein DUF4160
MVVVVENGVNKLEAEVTGRTVGQVRKLLQQPLNIDPAALPVVNGQAVGEGYTLEADDHHLEFVKAGGQKGNIVDIIKGLVVVIFPREHAPPHFHVQPLKENASFAIADFRRIYCRRFPETKGLKRRETEIISRWRLKNLNLLIERWNQLRPTDCPVGPIRQ